MVCRSQHPSGPFYDKLGRSCLSENGGTVVLESHGDVFAPGGQGVLFDPGHRAVVMYYHYVKPSVGYEYENFWFGWNALDFGSGWPVVEGLPSEESGLVANESLAVVSGTSVGGVVAVTSLGDGVATILSVTRATSTLSSGGMSGRRVHFGRW